MKKMLIIESTIISTLIGIKIYIKKIAFFPKCYFFENYGIFCPSCNFTRCIIALSNLDIVNAFLYQPILTISIIYLLLVNFIYIFNTISGKKVFIKFYPKPWHAIIFGILLIIYAIFKNIYLK